jgi:triacylglycerol lipase
MDRNTLFERIATWGSAFTPEMIQGTIGLYAPLALAPEEARVTRDVSYGPHERNRLDLFRPDGGGAAPCLLFVHGGGFVMGDKGNAGEPFHNHIGAWAAREGFVGATMTYRLAPEARWPDGRDDVIAAVKHLGENAASYGIAPGRIVIMGVSAGATHCADVVADPGDAAPHLGAAAMISGIYDLRIAEVDPFKPQYYGEDTGGWPQASSKAGLAQTKLPCLFTVSEFDPPDFQKQALALVEARVAETGHWPRMHWLAGHNHISNTSQIGSDHDDLGPLIADFIRGIA